MLLLLSCVTIGPTPPWKYIYKEDTRQEELYGAVVWRLLLSQLCLNFLYNFCGWQHSGPVYALPKGLPKIIECFSYVSSREALGFLWHSARGDHRKGLPHRLSPAPIFGPWRGGGLHPSILSGRYQSYSRGLVSNAFVSFHASDGNINSIFQFGFIVSSDRKCRGSQHSPRGGLVRASMIASYTTAVGRARFISSCRCFNGKRPSEDDYSVVCVCVCV